MDIKQNETTEKATLDEQSEQLKQRDEELQNLAKKLATRTGLKGGMRGVYHY